MIPNGLIAYTPQQIEAAATQLFRERVDFNFRPPINIERLVQETKNLDLQVKAGLKQFHKVEGCVCKEYLSVVRTIVIDLRVYGGTWAEYMEALAEEFAHVCLHAALFLEINTVEDFIELQSDPQWRRYEADARRFSAALRMPPTLVESELELAYARVVDEFGFGDVDKIEGQLRNRLADIFRVTKQSMQERLRSSACNHRNQILNSIQSRSLQLLPQDWTVRAVPPPHQRTFGDKSSRLR